MPAVHSMTWAYWDSERYRAGTGASVSSVTVASQSGTPTVGQFDLCRRSVCVSSENITTCSSPAGATAVASSKIAYAGGDNTPFGISDGAIANAHSACGPMTWAGHS